MLRNWLRRQQISRLFNLTLWRSIGGQRFNIPVFLKIGSGNLVATEPWMLDMLEKLLDESGVFVDIGANIGQTLLKVRSLSATVAYVGIEPNPACVFYLRELIAQNHFANCEIIPAGIYPQPDLLHLNLLADDVVDSSASLLVPALSGLIPALSGLESPAAGTTQYVALLPFEVIRRSLGLEHIQIVKIDVEGAELAVLESLQPVLAELRPLLLLEILPANNPARVAQQEKTAQLLAAQHYTLFRIRKNAHNGLAGLESIQEIGVQPDLSQCDYLAVPVDPESAGTSRAAQLLSRI